MKSILMVSTHGYFEGNPSFGREDTGGQIVFVIELSKALAKLGYKVDILSRQFEDFNQIEQLNEHVRIVRMPCGGKEFIPKEYLVKYLPELIDEFIKYCKNNGLEYTFVDSHYWDAGFVGTKLANEFKIPHIFTPHSLGIWKEMNTRKCLVEECVAIDEVEFDLKYNFKQRNSTEKVIMENANKVVATAPEQKSIINDKYGIPETKISVVPPGFFPEKYHKIDENELQKAIQKYKLPPRFAVTVGRIASNKGYDLLIKAFKDIVQEVPDVKLVFAIGSSEPNDVEQRQELSKLAESLGLSDSIMFFGHIDDLEVFYNAAEILIMPSTYEPFGMVAIEAMACGTPAIITTMGGLKDFLKDGEDALFVNPLDISSMAQIVVKMLKDKHLHRQIATRGYGRAHDLFTWDKIAESTLGILSLK